jgi:hypothetical protein
METVLGPNVSLWIYPDATLKTNKLPTGIVYFSASEDMLLFPAVLRDPGCGFLSFNIEPKKTLTRENYYQITKLLDELGNKRQKIPSTIELDTILYSPMPVDKKIVVLTADETDILVKDYMMLTNTIEIKKYHQVENVALLKANHIDPNNLFGFIHSGCFMFPRLLEKRFATRICDYAMDNQLSTLDKIREAIVGVPMNSPLGYEYQQWVNAAMNYAIASRHSLYAAVKEILEKNFDCRITMINDNLHAGLFCHDNHTFCSRGVQRIEKNKLTLIAGQRETMAALVEGGSECERYHNMIAHGVGFFIRDNYDYSKHFSAEELQTYQRMAKEVVYNTAPQYQECIPFTYNLLASLKDFENIKLAKIVSLLAPIINVQSDLLQ